MSEKSLNPLDLSWLLVESRETPMHVGGLIPFTQPEDAPPDFLRRLLADFRSVEHVAAPWNYCLQKPGWKRLRPAWKEQQALDLEHHVRLSALPHPGGERELGQLIARLHSQPLDLSRPPWECEFIEGLEGNRFALYIKMHHSLIDGVSGMKLLVRSMASNIQDSLSLPPFFALGFPARPSKRRESAAPTMAQVVNGLVDGARGQLSTVRDLAVAFGSMLKPGRSEESMAIPFDTPTSIINHRISQPRRFATQIFPLARLRAVAEASGATLNDVVLAICGGALRRFLDELGELPNSSLTAGIPVSVRPKDDEDAGNAITFIISTLGTDITDAKERLDAIRESTRRAKAHVASLPRRAMMQYTMLLMAPYTLSLLTGMAGRTRPMFNVTISNVPGPERPMYFRGARLEALYPVSLVTHGQALNITCQSYAGTLAFGFTACRDTLPHMQRIATYTGEALGELERLCSPATAAVKTNKSGGLKPAVGEPAVGKAVVGKSAATRKPVASKPVASKPVASKAVASKPSVRKEAVSGKPIASKRVASKPASAASTAGKQAQPKGTK